MTEPTDAPADPYAIIASLRAELATLREHQTTREAAFDERAEHQRAANEVLAAMAAAPGDAQPVFDLISRRASEMCEGRLALLLFDGVTVHLRATHGLPPGIVDDFTRTFPVPMEQAADNVFGRVIREKRVVHVPDMSNDRVARTPQGRALDGRSTVVVPFPRDGDPIGAIGLNGNPPGDGGFSEQQIALLRTFADQAAMAITNARLVAEQREALERQTAMADILRTINENPGRLEPVFEAILNKAHALCDATTGSLSLYNGEYLRAAVLHGYPEEHAARLRQPYALNAYHRQQLAGARYTHIPDLHEAVELRDHAISRSTVATTSLRTCLMVPLRVENQVRGFLTAFRSEVRAFTDKEITLVESFAAQAAIAMENARLLGEISQRQGELRITFESMGDGVALFDETRRLAAWNQNFQNMLDVPSEVISARPAFEEYIKYLADRGEYGADPGGMVQRLLSQGGQRASFERTRPNGQTIQIRTNPTPAGGFVVIYTDITERKRAEEALRAARDAAETALRELRIAQANLVQAEKMASLGQLTAGIAHEIKNPLNFVNNFAALSVDLLDEFKEAAAPALALLTEDQRADLDDVSDMLTTNLRKIEEHGKRADGIVRAMLEHSRGSSGERREVDVNALIDEALNLAYHGARAQNQSFNITMERDFATGLAPIELNPQDMTRVFLNIFSNGFYAANKRMRENGGDPPVLRVTTRSADDTVEIRIRDNGTGIPADIRDKLFEPFFTTKPTGEGTGLGLSITYDIVTKSHGGTITVASEPGVYTEFLVTLPRHMFAGQGERP
jgi:signal transduction histidine kinase